MNIFPLHATDFYKTGHFAQYPKGSEFVYENFTCRSSKLFTAPHFDGKVVFFGLQYVLKNLLVDTWNKNFFERQEDEVVAKYKRRMDLALGPDAVDMQHIRDLHRLGYLPIEVKALPEGARVNVRVPLFTMKNTVAGFAWLVGYLETAISAELWQTVTSATTAYEYRKMFNKFADATGAPREFTPWQGHDFSARGMVGMIGGAVSGMGHLTSFTGTDTVLALDFLEEYYHGADTFLGGSVPATEHSVMCMGGKEEEIETFRRLIHDVYPTGIVSIVSDTWDFWEVITQFTRTLHNHIKCRNGKVVFRPDSGDPVKIIVGEVQPVDFSDLASLDKAKEWMREKLDDDVRGATPHGEHGDSEATGYFKYDNKVYKLTVEFEWNRYDKQYYFIDNSRIKSCEEAILTPAQKGAVECLWEVFGGTVTDKGFKVLDSHVGLIYGDSISLDRAQRILSGLKAKGFASNNIVFGIGSFTYQYVTRDTFGTAIKATWGQVDGEPRDLFKKPKTDDGMKNSACGLIRVERENGEYVLYDQQTPEQEQNGLLTTVFKDGKVVIEHTIAEIRTRLEKE